MNRASVEPGRTLQAYKLQIEALASQLRLEARDPKKEGRFQLPSEVRALKRPVRPEELVSMTLQDVATSLLRLAYIVGVAAQVKASVPLPHCLRPRTDSSVPSESSDGLNLTLGGHLAEFAEKIS